MGVTDKGLSRVLGSLLPSGVVAEKSMEIPDFRETDRQVLATLRTELAVSRNSEHQSMCSVREVLGAVLSLIVVLALPIGGTYLYWKSSHDEKVHEQALVSAKRERDNAIRADILALAGRYSAIADWWKGLGKDSMESEVFSASLTKLLVRRDGRPILFVASLRDVSEDAQGYIIDFDAPVTFLKQMRLRLRCTEAQGQAALSFSRNERRRYAVVARIDSVQSADGVNDIEGEPEPSLVIAQFLDVLPVGSYIGDYRDMTSLSRSHD